MIQYNQIKLKANIDNWGAGAVMLGRNQDTRLRRNNNLTNTNTAITINTANGDEYHATFQLPQHQHICQLLKLLGYKIDHVGVCMGVQRAWVQSALIPGGIAKHLRRLHYFSDPDTAAQHIKSATAKQGKNLTPFDQEMLDVKAHAENIYILQKYHRIKRHFSYMEDEKIAEILHPPELKARGGAVQIHSTLSLYSKNELRELLDKTIAIFDEHHEKDVDQVVIKIESIDHCTAIKFNPETRAWCYCDANLLNTSVVDNDLIVAQLFNSFYWHGNKNLALGLKFVTTVSNPIRESLQTRLQELNQLHPVSRKNIERVTADGHHLLTLAAAFGSPTLIDEIIRNGANTDKANTHTKLTPLYYACLIESYESAKKLIECGADPNYLSADTGTSPLSIAAYYGNIKLVELLLKNGANPVFMDKKGRTPAMLAKKNHHRKIHKIILDHEKNSIARLTHSETDKSIWHYYKRQGELHKIEPLTLFQFYEYVFCGKAVIDVSAAPKDKQKEIREHKQAAFRMKFAPMIHYFGHDLRMALNAYGGNDLDKILFDTPFANNHSYASLGFDDGICVEAPKYLHITEKQILTLFSQINYTYNYFTPRSISSALQTRFIISYRMLLLNNFIAIKNTQCIDIYERECAETAYKLLVLFEETASINPLKKFEQFLKIHVNVSLDTITELSLPHYHAHLNMNLWRRTIFSQGKKALDEFQKINHADRYYSFIKHTKDQQAMLQAVDPNLAKFCLQHGFDAATSHYCAALVKQRKTVDLIPDITIDGDYFGFNGYRLMKLQANDLDALIPGKYTGKCDRIDGLGKRFIHDALTHPDKGYYALYKKNTSTAKFEMVGNGFAWISESTLVIDNWNNSNSAHDQISFFLLNALAQRITQECTQIHRVTLGVEAEKAAQSHRNWLIDAPLPQHTNTLYYDSVRQFLLHNEPVQYANNIRQLCCLIDSADETHFALHWLRRLKTAILSDHSTNPESYYIRIKSLFFTDSILTLPAAVDLRDFFHNISDSPLISNSIYYFIDCLYLINKLEYKNIENLVKLIDAVKLTYAESMLLALMIREQPQNSLLKLRRNITNLIEAGLNSADSHYTLLVEHHICERAAELLAVLGKLTSSVDIEDQVARRNTTEWEKLRYINHLCIDLLNRLTLHGQQPHRLINLIWKFLFTKESHSIETLLHTMLFLLQHNLSIDDKIILKLEHTLARRSALHLNDKLENKTIPDFVIALYNLHVLNLYHEYADSFIETDADDALNLDFTNALYILREAGFSDTVLLRHYNLRKIGLTHLYVSNEFTMITLTIIELKDTNYLRLQSEFASKNSADAQMVLNMTNKFESLLLTDSFQPSDLAKIFTIFARNEIIMTTEILSRLISAQSSRQTINLSTFCRFDYIERMDTRSNSSISVELAKALALFKLIGAFARGIELLQNPTQMLRVAEHIQKLMKKGIECTSVVIDYLAQQHNSNSRERCLHHLLYANLTDYYEFIFSNFNQTKLLINLFILLHDKGILTKTLASNCVGLNEKTRLLLEATGLLYKSDLLTEERFLILTKHPEYAAKIADIYIQNTNTHDSESISEMILQLVNTPCLTDEKASESSDETYDSTTSSYPANPAMLFHSPKIAHVDKYEILSIPLTYQPL